jgi:RNA polymerase sigma-70 factor (ECF subfamily)
VAGDALPVNGLNDSVAPWGRSARSPSGERGGDVSPRQASIARGARVASISRDLVLLAVRTAPTAVPGGFTPTRRPVDVTGLARRSAEGRKPVAPAIVALVPRAAAGDEAAFTRLVEEFHADMARLAYFICGGNRELAEDAVQSAWMIAWSRLSTLRDHQRIRAWLLSVTANEARQAMRKQRRVAVFGIEFAEERVGAPGPYPSAIALDMADVLARLKPEERTLVGLRYAAGLDSAEIGTVLGMSASGVRSRLIRLLDRLRAELEQ